MENIDLRLLRMLDELYKTRNVSKASSNLGLTQPAVSIALGKLRRHFGDPLFVATPGGMEPTSHATGMIGMIREAIALLDATMGYHQTFKPAESDRMFRISMTDIGQIVVLPAILNKLTAVAPGVRVHVSNITAATANLLETGEVDLAVGFVPQLQDRFFQQAIFEEHFACLARSDHPRIKGSLTRDVFRHEAHVVVSSSGTGHLIVDTTLERLKVKRKVAVHIPNFLGLATVVGNTDNICTLPARAGAIMARSGEAVCWPCPFPLPRYTVRQHWHERQGRDPGNIWLREIVRSCAAE